MTLKKKKAKDEKDRSFIAISPEVHKEAKDFADKNGWGIGWFTEKSLQYIMKFNIDIVNQNNNHK